LLVNPVGTGRAILLNFQLFAAKPDGAEAAATRRLLRALYDAGGVKAPLTSSAPDGGPLPQTETRVWRSGDALLFGMWRQMECAWFNPKSGTTAGPPVPARVELPSPSHVYDLRAGKYLGRVKSLDTRLRWGRANVFLALPYEIKEMAIRLSSSTPGRGETVRASIRLRVPRDAQEKHAVWVEVTDPEGRRPLWGQRVVMLERGAGEAQFPIAYNDPPGEWRVRATELFSKASAEAAWTVR